MMRSLMISLFSLLILSSYGGNFKSKLIHAKEYEVVDEYDMRMMNKKRRTKSFIIISQAKSFDERGQTAMLAAYELSKKHHLDLCEVMLIPAKGLERSSMQESRATYASDNKGYQGSNSGVDPQLFTKGKWMVWSSDQQYTEQELRISILWFSKRHDFRSKDAMSSLSYDAIALTEYIADSLQIEPSEVKTFYIDQRIYDSELVKNWMKPNPHLEP